RHRSVDVAPNLWRGALEIEMQSAVADLELHGERHRTRAESVPLEPVLGPARHVADRGKTRDRAALRVREERVARRRKSRRTLTRHERTPPRRAGGTRAALCREIAASLFGRPDVREDQLHHALVRNSAPLEPDRRQDDPLLHELRRALRHGTGTHPAHVRVMRADRGVTRDLAAYIDS